MPSARPYFSTPQEAEDAFYDALERADLDAMMAIWAEDEEIVCVHPGGPRLVGIVAVRDSWRNIFDNVKKLRVTRTGQVVVRGLMLTVSCVLETIGTQSESRKLPPTVSTNVFQHMGHGWRLLSRHSSPVPLPHESVLPDMPRLLH